MAIISVGPDVTKQAIIAAIVQMVGTVDLFKNREQALSALLTQIPADADLVSIGFTQAEVTYLRNGIAALDSLVSQGLANNTVKAFCDRARNFGQ